MKLPQAPSFDFERFKKELITFPGYAGILLGWLAVAAFVVVGVISIFAPDQPANTTIVVQTPAEASVGGSIIASILGVIILVAMIGALWVYVARWTKAGVAWAAKTLRVEAKNYWTFCTILLIVGWLIASGLVFLASGDAYLDAFAFAAAAIIAIGSASFGVAALVGQNNNHKQSGKKPKTKKPADKS